MNIDEQRRGTIEIDPSNAEQLTAWDGEEGAYWALHADRFDRSIAAHHEPFVRAAAVVEDDVVLDIGCGTGQTTRGAARAARSGSVLGIDLSSAMLEHARQRAADEGLTNVAFVRGDAQVHAFEPRHFTVALARTSAMFFGDHHAAFDNIHRALRPSGRLVMLTWQPLSQNEWLREISTSLAVGRPPMLPPPGAGPMSLSEPGRVRQLLTAAGFADIELEGNEAPMWFGDDPDIAFHFILGLMDWKIRDLDDADKATARDALADTIAEHHGPDGVTFASATWITTARAGHA